MAKKRRRGGLPKIVLTGQRFGMLEVLHQGKTVKKHTRWICRCDCGRPRFGARSGELRAGRVTDCGCVSKARRFYLRNNERLRRIWYGMLTRSPVRDPAVLAIYRGPGTHDPAWDEFDTFRVWATENGYKDNLTIDRIDNNGGYWPGNCRWATNAQQCNNKTTNVYLDYLGKRMTISQIARAGGVFPGTVAARHRAGWPTSLLGKKLSFSESRRIYAKCRAASG